MAKLVVSEKPSVANSLSAVLGAKSKKDGYYEGNGYVVSWCVGHLLGLAPPDAYGENTPNGASKIYQSSPTLGYISRTTALRSS